MEKKDKKDSLNDELWDLWRYARNVALRFTGKVDEDIASEAIVRLLQEKDKIVGEWKPWLYSVVRNLCFDKVEELQTCELEQVDTSGVCKRPNIDILALREAIGKLGAEAQRYVGLRLEGRTDEEIAIAMGLSVSQVKKLWLRAVRPRLREILGDTKETLG